MMRKPENASWSNCHLLALVCLLFGATVLFHVTSAVKGHSLYRDQHLGTAIEYSHTGIDLFKPVIIGFNATKTPTPLELPLWQAATALAFKAFGGWFGWANIVSLLLFATCLVPLFELARNFFGERCAWWTLVFFLAQPLVFIYAGTASTEGFSLATAIWFLFSAVKLLQRPGVGWWMATTVTGVIAAVSKMPYFLAAGLTCFLLVALFHRKSLKPWMFLGTAAAVIGAVFILWTSYTNRCLAAAVFPYLDLRLSDPAMVFWYFGDLHYRLSPGNWVKGGWRFLNACFGSFALAGLFAYAIFFLRGKPFAKIAIAGAAVTTLVFTHLVLHHTHYYLMFSPAVAMLCAQAAVELEKKFVFESRWMSRMGLGCVAAILGMSLIQGLVGIHVVLGFDHYPDDIAKIVAKNTGASDKLVIQGGGWGGQVLFLSGREGLSIWNTEILEKPENVQRLKGLGFNTLVMISGSPLLAAVEKSSSTQAELDRESYRKYLTAVAKEWPTIYESEDIIIKRIP